MAKRYKVEDAVTVEDKPKLADVLSEANGDYKHPVQKITNEEAAVLTSLSMAPILVSEKARAALTYYLQVVLERQEVTNDEARAAAAVIKQAATSGHRELCNQVLAKYLAKFDWAKAKEAVGA